MNIASRAILIALMLASPIFGASWGSKKSFSKDNRLPSRRPKKSFPIAEGLRKAISDIDVESVRSQIEWLKGHFKENYPEMVSGVIDAGDAKDHTPLMIVAKLKRFKDQKRSVPIVAELIKAGADLDLQDKNGRTALLLAVKSDNTPVAVKLIESGADHTIKDNNNDDVQKELRLEPNNEVIEALKLAKHY